MKSIYVRMKALLLIAGMAVFCLGSVKAAPIVEDTWYVGAFSALGGPVTGAGFSAGGAIDPGAPAWTISLTDPAVLRVFDCCALGDAFEVFDFGTSLGVTSIGSATCNSAAACETGSGLSRGDFLLSSGSHSITMTVTSFVGQGNMFFVVQQVPEPGTLALLGLGLAGLAASRRRKQ